MAQPKTCVSDFKGVVQDWMSGKEADSLIKEVKARTRARQERRLMPRAEALNMSIDELIAEREFMEKVSRRQSTLAMIKAINAEKQIRAFKNRSKGAFAYFGGVESNIPNSRVSVVGQILADNLKAKSYFLTLMEKEGIKAQFDDLKNGTELAKALWDKDAVVSPEIRKLAKVIKRVNENLVKQLNREGAAIKTVDDYVAKLSHNKRLMMSATGFGLKDSALRGKLLIKNKGDWSAMNKEFTEIAYTRWRNFTRPHLNADKTFERVPQADEEDFMRSVYESVISGIHKVPYTEQGHPMITPINSNLGKTLSAKRVLHWKDGTSWEAYNKSYGHGSVHDAIISHIDHMSKSLGIMKRLGTSPRVFAERLLRKMEKEGRDISNLNANRKRFHQSKNVLNAVLGDDEVVPDGLIGKMISATRTFSYLVKMGHITLASIPDLNNMMSALKMHNIPNMEVMSEALTNLAKGMPKGAAKELSLDLGTYSDGSIGTMMNKLGNVDTVYGVFSKAMKINDKLIGINRWDSINRHSMGYMLSRNLAKLSHLDFDDLPMGEQRTLEISGVNKNIWGLLKANTDQLTEIKGQKFLAPSIIDRISDKSIHANMSPDVKLSPAKMARLRQTMKDRLSIYFTDQTAYGKIFPNASDMALMNFGINKSTLPGKLWGLVTMFKSFHVASFRRTIGRFLYSKGADNLYDALVGGKADYKGMMDYMIKSLPWGYVSMAAQNASYGLLPPSLSDKNTYIESALRGGLVPLWGSLLMNSYQSSGGLVSFLGPGASMAKDVGTILSQVASGKSPKVQATWFAEKNTPYLHTFYYDLILKRMFLDGINEHADPTYKYKQQQRARKNNKQYYWPMS